MVYLAVSAPAQPVGFGGSVAALLAYEHALTLHAFVPVRVEFVGDHQQPDPQVSLRLVE